MVFSRSLALGFSTVLLSAAVVACSDSTQSPKDDANTGGDGGGTPTKPFEGPIDSAAPDSGPGTAVDATDAGDAGSATDATTIVDASDASDADSATSAPDATDPLVSALTDPSRASRPFECRGADLGVSDLRLLFEPGTADLDFGPSGFFGRGLERGDLQLALRSRVCSSANNCSAWMDSAPPSGPIALTVHLNRRAEQRLAIVDGLDAARILGAVDFPEPDQIVPFSTAGRARLARVRFTREPDGRSCLSVAGPSVTEVDANGTRTTRFEIARVYFADPTRPSSGAGELAPSEAPQYKCAGTNATADDLSAGWMPPGAPSAAFAGHPRTRLVSSRVCHPLTGCTAWGAGDLSIVELVGALSAPFRIVANVPFSGQPLGRPTELQPSVSAFGGSFDGTTVEGIVSPTCVSLSAQSFEAVPGVADVFMHKVAADRYDAN